MSNMTTEARTVTPFTALELKAAGTINWTQGEDYSLTVTAPEDIMPDIITAVEGDTLVISFDRVVSSIKNDIVFNITAPSLQLLRVSGAGKFNAGLLNAEEFTLEVPGTLKLNILNLQCQKLYQHIKGTANMTIAGRAEYQRIEAKGVLNYHGEHLLSNRTDIRSAGVTNATLWVQDRLRADLQGMSNVRYYGEPEFERRSGGFSRVKQLGTIPA